MCISPSTKTLDDGTVITFPCGGCLGCRVDSLLLWTARCQAEYNKYRSSFVTLTYNDTWLYDTCFPNDKQLQPTLVREHLHCYIDNLKHKALNVLLPEGNNPHFKYFACGEYGDNGLRNHFHILIFGLDFKDAKKLIESTWKYGFVKVLPVLDGGIRYVVDYFTKNLTGEYAKQAYDDKHIARPFKCSSKGLGFSFFYDHRDEICNNGNIKIGSKLVPVPSYYKNLFFDFSDDALASRINLKMKQLEDMKQSAISYGLPDVNSFRKYIRHATDLRLVQQYRDKGVPVQSAFSPIANQPLINEVENILKGR